jgi:hypothetical protein
VAILIFLPNLLWNASHGWVAIVVQGRHGLGSHATLRSVLEFLGGLIGGAGIVALPLGLWRILRGRNSFTVRVAVATLVPVGVLVFSAMRGRVEANWGAAVYPALCGAAAAELVRLRPAWSQGLLAFTVGLGMIAAVGFGLELRNPALIPADSVVVQRFRGWPEYAAKARVAAGLACGSIGDPPGCRAGDPFVYTSSYQEAAALAYYAGWTRFGPAAERPSQLDLWNEEPRPGAAFLVVGDIVQEKRLFAAEGVSPPAISEVRLRGKLLHPIEVSAWRSWEGRLPRRTTDLEYLKDVLPR